MQILLILNFIKNRKDMVTKSDLVPLSCWLQLLVYLNCFGYNLFILVSFVSLTERTPS